MDTLLVSTLTFLFGLIAGFFIGKNWWKTTPTPTSSSTSSSTSPSTSPSTSSSLKVLHKSEPKTFEEKRSEALDKDKPMIKTFYK